MWRGVPEGDQGGSPPPTDPPEEHTEASGSSDIAVVKQELGDLQVQTKTYS